jgi:hypothetical protein
VTPQPWLGCGLCAVPLQNTSLKGSETVLAVRTAADANQDTTSVALLRFDLGIDPAR